MTKRENIIKILRKEGGEHIPFELSFTPKLQKEFEQRTGTDNVAEYYDFDFRRVGSNSSRRKLNFSKYYEGKSLKEGYYFDDYGDKLSFWGTIGTQSTMPFGTPQDVKDVVKNMAGLEFFR